MHFICAITKLHVPIWDKQGNGRNYFKKQKVNTLGEKAGALACPPLYYAGLKGRLVEGGALRMQLVRRRFRWFLEVKYE